MEKKIRKKSYNAEKTVRGDPLGFNNIHSVAKHQKIEGGRFGEFFFEKKSLEAEKNERGRFGIFQHPFECKISKILKGGPFGLTRYCMLLEKRKNFFGSIR